MLLFVILLEASTVRTRRTMRCIKLLTLCVFAGAFVRVQTAALASLLLRPDLRGIAMSSAVSVDESSLQSILHGVQQEQSESLYLLAMMKYYGHGMERDVRAAVKLLKKAAQHAHRDAEFALGVLHSTGEGGDVVVPSDRMSAMWLSNSANRGHVDAKWMLAMYVASAAV